MAKIAGSLWLLLLVGSIAKAQNEVKPQAGLLRAQLTISPGYNFSERQSYFYLHGNVEGYVEDNLSLSGDGYLSLKTDKNIFSYNHSLFTGFSKHFVRDRNDFYIGLQPGLSFTKLDEKENNLAKTSSGVNPLISSMVGYNFYVSNLFHFFLQVRLVVGQHNYDAPKDLSELRLSAGLGFNRKIRQSSK